MNRRTFIKSGALFVPTIFVPRLIRAQSISALTAPGAAAIAAKKAASGGGGGGGTWTFVDSTVAASANGDGFTTSAINSAGSTFTAIVLASYSAHPTPTDSKGNTYSMALNLSSGDGGVPGSSRQISIFYCAAPTVGSGHTATLAGSGTYAVMAFYAFSGGAGGSLDQTNSNVDTNATTTLQPGSITPSTANQLIITGIEFRSGSNAAINSGFATPQKAAQTANNVGGAGSYLIQGAAAAVNPTWTIDSVDFPCAAIASFQ
jgi:hypothetical protein